MTKGPLKTVGKATVERLQGTGPSRTRALMAAVVTGVAAAAVTYRALRSGQ